MTGSDMTDRQFIRDLQRFTALTAVNVTALRRQGVGVIGRIQSYLANLDLSGLAALQHEDGFGVWLQNTTQGMVSSKGCPEIRWGAARKALNLFLRDALYSKYISRQYGLEHVEKWLEAPLDSVVAQYLKRKAGRGQLPVWNGLRHLTPEESEQFQRHASRLARQRGLARVHLDVGIWVNNRVQNGE